MGDEGIAGVLSFIGVKVNTGIYRHAAELVDILNFGRKFSISVYKWVNIFVCDCFPIGGP
jgi:hypothetical protein